MGKLASTVQEYICDSLAVEGPDRKWETEYMIAGTPVDIAGKYDQALCLFELEWRRADPADNAAKIFRHLSEGKIESKQILVFQMFTSYYDLASGGVSTKRKNAEFVGDTASKTYEHLFYTPVELDIDPPKRGGELSDRWQTEASKTVTTLRAKIDHLQR